MQKLLISLLIIYLILNPFYVFPSGMPQPADYLSLLAISIFLINGKYHMIANVPSVRHLRLLFFIILLVNSIVQFSLILSGDDGRPMQATLYYFYNFVFFGLVLYLLKTSEVSKYISLFTILSLFIQLFLILFDIGSSSGGRETGFFNNPNQLGYYSLLSLSIFTVIPSKYRRSGLISLLVILISGYLVLLSGSRASLVGVGLLAIILFIIEGVKLNIRYLLVLIVFGVFGISVFTSNNVVVDQIESFQRRNEMKNSTVESEWRIRGYDRIMLYPEYLFFGAGEFANKRFTKSFHQLEMHTAYGTMIFSYGILGFFMFCKFLWGIIKKRVFLNFLILIPVLSYNLTHQGLRTTLLWILFALVLFYSTMTKEENAA